MGKFTWLKCIIHFCSICLLIYGFQNIYLKENYHGLVFLSISIIGFGIFNIINKLEKIEEKLK